MKSDAMSEPIYIVDEYMDGPISGMTSYCGKPHHFARVFDHSIDDYTNDFWITPLQRSRVEMENDLLKLRDEMRLKKIADVNDRYSEIEKFIELDKLEMAKYTFLRRGQIKKVGDNGSYNGFNNKIFEFIWNYE